MSSGLVGAIRTSSGVGLLERFRQLFARRETIRYLVSSQLKAGHRDKVLGHLWNLLDPMLFVGVYFVVFGVLFRQRGAGGNTEYILYLSVGVLAWRFHGAAISQATNCVRGNRGLIHEISFPKAVFPVAICFSRLYDFLWGLVVVALLALLLGNGFSKEWSWLVPLLFLQLLFTLGIAFIVAHLGAFFADTVNIVDVGLRLWFYFSPLFYQIRGPQSIIPERFLKYYMLNPMAGFFEAYRSALLQGQPPETGALIYVGVVSTLAAVIGFAVFARGEGSFAKYV